MRRNAVAAVAAIFIVLCVAAVTGSKMQRPAFTLEAERVSMTKNTVVKPQNFAPMPAASAVPMGTVTRPQIARTGKVNLFVADVDKSVSTLSRIARQQNGDVFALQVTNADAATRASADMSIRVPADRFDATLAAVTQAGNVRDRSVSAEDLTGDITDSSARLRNLRRTESDIRKIMDRSGTVTQVLDAENQLSQVREQIETLESEIKSMEQRVVYSTIDVGLEAEAANAPVEPTAVSQLGAAWQASVHAFSQTTVALIAIALWLVVFAPYVLIAALVAFAAYAQLRKRLGGVTITP
jgi:hypothetical protein